MTICHVVTLDVDGEYHGVIQLVSANSVSVRGSVRLKLWLHILPQSYHKALSPLPLPRNPMGNKASMAYDFAEGGIRSLAGHSNWCVPISCSGFSGESHLPTFSDQFSTNDLFHVVVFLATDF